MGLFYHTQSVVLNCGSNINQSQQNMAVIACLNGQKTVIRLRFSMQLRKILRKAVILHCQLADMFRRRKSRLCIRN